MSSHAILQAQFITLHLVWGMKFWLYGDHSWTIADLFKFNRFLAAISELKINKYSRAHPFFKVMTHVRGNL